MTSRFLLVASLFSALVITASSGAKAGDPLGMTEVWSHNFSMNRTWHGPYQTQQWGQPLALVVPPTAHMRQSYSWGVSQNLMHPIYHQFGRSANNPGAAGYGSFYYASPWPSHTDQFGYSYVRGPWK